MHIGKVIIGIVPLHRRGLPVYFSGCMLDKRCEEFTSAVIGGCQGSLAYGPRVFEVFPDLPVRLADPVVHEALTLGLQTKGYECFHSQSHNLAIHYSYCVRFYKTHIPPTLQVPTQTSGVVTLHDEELDQLVPTYLALADLTPSDQWVTQWDSIRQYNPQAIDANSRITEIDGQVLTQFPQRSAPAQCGLSSPSILSTTANNFTVHSSSSPSSRLLVQSIPYEVHEQVISQLLAKQQKAMQKFLQEAHSNMLTQMNQLQILTSSLPSISINPQDGFGTTRVRAETSFPYAPVCDHPHCSPTLSDNH